MTAPLRVVGTPAHRALLIKQARTLQRLAGEAQQRHDVICSERRRVLRELHTDGMSHTQIAQATGIPRHEVIRRIGARRDRAGAGS